MSNHPRVVLWQTVEGVRCMFVRRESGLPFEVTITHGSAVLKQREFDEDAATFAIDEMHALHVPSAMNGGARTES